MDFDFLSYVEKERAPTSGRDDSTGFGEYAFAGDIRVLRKLQRMKPVRLVAQAAVRFWRSMEKNELLGTGVKVSRRQYPRLYDMVVECAHTLDVSPPTVYVTKHSQLNAGTYGTETESFIVLNGGIVEHFDDEELKFVLGHECGHLQNNHVVYHTAAQFLAQGVASIVRWAVAPAQMALNGWSRRGEITCDRAGLMCCEDLDTAVGTMLKLSVGTNALFDDLDVDEYMAQLEDLQQGFGRVKEYFQEHPYIPKRIKALRLFAESEYYRRAIGEQGGRPLDEIDREVEQLVKVFG